MATKTPSFSYLRVVGVVFLQLVMTQVVTFIFSLFFPDTEVFPQTHSVFFAFVLGITFSVGVFLPGGWAIRQGWLEPARYLTRFLGALVGAYLPLIIALFLYSRLEPGNPFFLLSILASIAGFYVPGWFKRSQG